MGDSNAAPGRRARHEEVFSDEKALEKLNRLSGETAPVPAERMCERFRQNKCTVSARSRPKTMNWSEQKIRKYFRMSSAVHVGA
jgi:hypothetical protein